MLRALLFVLLAICNAQWPLQSIGHEEIKPLPPSPDQPGYPYDDVHLVENIPNPSLSQILTKDPPKLPRIVHGANLKLPEVENQNVKGNLEALDDLDSSSASSDSDLDSVESDILAKDPPKLPRIVHGLKVTLQALNDPDSGSSETIDSDEESLESNILVMDPPKLPNIVHSNLKLPEALDDSDSSSLTSDSDAKSVENNILAKDPPKLPRIVHGLNLKLPEVENQNVKVTLQALNDSVSGSSETIDSDAESLESNILAKDPPKLPRIVHGLNLKLPEVKNQNDKVTLQALDDSDSSSVTSANDEHDESTSPKPSLEPKFPVPAELAKIVGNVTLSELSSVKDRVAYLINDGRALRNDTDQLVNQLNLLYLNLAVDETDNEARMENSYKYGMSVILRFLFEFYRIFRRLSSQTTQTQLRLTNVDVYGISYDKAVDVMKEKRGYSPLEISAPIRRSFDIFKSIIYESVIIVQTKCRTTDPNLKCIIIFLANLISETLKCSNVWYHAFIHMLALEKLGLHDSFVYKIAYLDKFKELTSFENIFDFIIDKIQEYRELGRVQLSAEAIFFTMLADLQENGLLDCISLDFLYN